ncbi:MAG: hypothetical protein QG662_1241, partial [Pseudomonadota bacterium]|nr:hypothetical protein [Pseudomonadota bacterium]
MQGVLAWRSGCMAACLAGLLAWSGVVGADNGAMDWLNR